MSGELHGNVYKYIIDTSYGINQDGFIAIGTESIVYKGLKTRHDSELQFSCVLKFKPKRAQMADGTIVDRVKVFMEEEWSIFEELRECRSIVKIDDVIEDLGEFSLPCGYVYGGVINRDSYFCVVEEFIDGWNLDEFCRMEYWKLARIEPLDNGLSKIVDYSHYTAKEKDIVLKSYNYDNSLKYQNMILMFMSNLCEIMQYVTENKYILHLDIKPENIMVTKYGKELVLIDFGRSRRFSRAVPYVDNVLPPVNYSRPENITMQYQHGTLGYAAPECFCEATDDSRFPFEGSFRKGKMSIESDIFSFGATFWECLNMFELVTNEHSTFSKDAHDFYQEHFLNDSLYCNRNLSCTSQTYHKKLEAILRKCTRRRADSPFADHNDKDFYHSYAELKKDLEDAKDSVPTIVREENVKAKNAFIVCGAFAAVCLVFLIIIGIYRIRGYDIAQDKWATITESYNDTQFFRLEDTAKELISTAPAAQKSDIYTRIAPFTYVDSDISEAEAMLLVELLQDVGDNGRLPDRVDEIMEYANPKKFKEIVSEIVKLDEVPGSTGYALAQAIYDVEVGNTNILEAYAALEQNKNNEQFHSAVVKLKNVLNNDAYVSQIAQATGRTRAEIQDYFKSIS